MALTVQNGADFRNDHPDEVFIMFVKNRITKRNCRMTNSSSKLRFTDPHRLVRVLEQEEYRNIHAYKVMIVDEALVIPAGSDEELFHRTNCLVTAKEIKFDDLGSDMAMFKKLARTTPDVLTMMEPEKRTYPMCETVIKFHPTALPHVPEEHKTDGLCARAMRGDPTAFSHIPDEKKTDEMYEQFVNSSNFDMDSLSEGFRTEGLYKALVVHKGLKFSQVPKEHRSRAMCELAVSSQSS